MVSLRAMKVPWVETDGGVMVWVSKMGFCWHCVVLLVFTLGTENSFSQQKRSLFTDPDAVDISLITVEPGNLVYDNFGHTALRVNDHASGQDLAFNWGIFDFSDPISFSLRFYKGILIYKLGVYPYRFESSRFKVEQRTAYEDKLALTRSQKEILLKRLIWHIQPENIDYRYDYFFDNCATRPRDYIDEALGGALRMRFSVEPTGQTFRESMRLHYRSLPPIDLILDVLMNSRIDLKMSMWDKGFLPVSLRDMLLASKNTKINDGSGPAPLVEESRVLVHFDPRWDAGISGHLAYLLIIGGLILGFFQYLYLNRSSATISRRAMRCLGAAALTYGLLFGLIGLLMPLNWLLSDHQDLHHNANMMFFWPTDLVYVYLGYKWLRYGSPVAVRGATGHFLARHYQDLHCIFMALGMVLWALGVIRQDIAAISIYVLPPTLLLWILFRRYGFCRNTGGCGATVHGKKGN